MFILKAFLCNKFLLQCAVQEHTFIFPFTGKFWNIPVTVEQFTYTGAPDPYFLEEELYAITLHPAGGRHPSLQRRNILLGSPIHAETGEFKTHNGSFCHLLVRMRKLACLGACARPLLQKPECVH